MPKSHIEVVIDCAQPLQLAPADGSMTSTPWP
jgi:hypothetical protein